MHFLFSLSRVSRRWMTGEDESWCAHAWEHRHGSSFWAAWVRVFGHRHCEKSWRYYRRRQ